MITNKANQIFYPNRYKQLIGFKGLDIGVNMYPTDIDGLIEYRDIAYIFFDVKKEGTPFKKGQRLALKRLVKDTSLAGKMSIAFLLEHTVENTNEVIYAEDCYVEQICTFDTHTHLANWRRPKVAYLRGGEAFHSVINLFKQKEKELKQNPF